MEKFFDINFWISSNDYWLSSELYSNKKKYERILKIAEKLSDNKINRVIISNKFAVDYDWNVGNQRLLKTNLIDLEKVYYSFILNPDAFFTYNFKEYIKEAFEKKVRIFRIFPKTQLFYVNNFYMEKIFSIIGKAQFPVMLDLKQLDITGNKYFDIGTLEKILERNENIPFILEASLKQCMFSRIFFPLLEKYKNVYLEISGLLLYDQIEHYVEKFGSQRLLFGSNYPNLPIEININRLILADISEKNKENIAFKNIDRLLKEIKIDQI